jgi:hypothetical protein
MKQRFLHLQRNDQGSVVVYVALLMSVFVGFLALSVDTGHWFAVSNELHNAGDASALAGARAYYPMALSTGVPELLDPDPVAALSGDPIAAYPTGASHTINVNAADNLALSELSDFKTGVWDYQARQLLTPLAAYWPPPFGSFRGPGVTLSTRKEAGVNTGPVNNFFGRIFGNNNTNIKTVSAAALSGVGGFYAGTGTFPIAVNVDLVKKAGDIIYFNPDTLDPGGWTSLSDKQASAEVFKDLIDGSVNGNGPNPEVKDGDIIKLQNGVACSAVKEIIKAYKLKEDKDLKGCYASNILVKFPGVEVDKFNQSAEVKGGLIATIVWVRDSNAVDQVYDGKSVTGKCMLILKVHEGVVGGTMGGGPYYGVVSVQPKLVQ